MTAAPRRPPRSCRISRQRFRGIAGVVVHLSAAGLRVAELDRVPEPLEHRHDRLAGLGEERVVVAADEEGDEHVSYRGVGSSVQLPASGLQIRCRCSCRAGSWSRKLELSKKRLRQPAVDGDDVAGGLGALVAGQEADRVGVVLRQDRPAGDRAAGVELGQLARAGPRSTPTRRTRSSTSSAPPSRGRAGTSTSRRSPWPARSRSRAPAVPARAPARAPDG